MHAYRTQAYLHTPTVCKPNVYTPYVRTPTVYTPTGLVVFAYRVGVRHAPAVHKRDPADAPRHERAGHRAAQCARPQQQTLGARELARVQCGKHAPPHQLRPTAGEEREYTQEYTQVGANDWGVRRGAAPLSGSVTRSMQSAE
eukprot:9504085-Pyramimonas_sp.AAC.1